jgi:hypothetical protein
MASPFGTIGQLALGSLVSRGADRLLDPNKRNVVGINKFVPQGGYFGTEGDDETKTGPTTLGGIAKTGIMSLIANAIFGPIFAPLALNLATRFVDKRKGLGFFGQDDSQDIGPEDVRGTFTAEGMQFENIQDALGSSDPNKDINYNTGVITDKTTGKEIGNVYDEVALTNVPEPPAYDFDDSGSDSGGDSGGTGTMDASDFSDDSPGTPFRYGGIASLYR